jgi:hypothetical protein
LDTLQLLAAESRDCQLEAFMSRCSKVSTYCTTRGLARFQIEVWHDELGKYQVVKGDDLHVVTQMANVKARQWDEIWERKVLAEDGRRQRSQLAL